jgi:hypothetical protein
MKRRKPKAKLEEEIKDEDMHVFRTAGECEICGKWCSRRDVFHIYGRAAGGPDIRCNILSVGSWYPYPHCSCHSDWGAGVYLGEKMPVPVIRLKLLEIAGNREGMLPTSIIEECWRIRRLKTRGF